MPSSVSLQRYLQRYIERELPDPPANAGPWHNVLVIPAYREAATLLDQLARVSPHSAQTLIILVLNRPDSDPDSSANQALRAAIQRRPERCGIYPLNERTDLYLHDMESLAGPLPAAQGVGLARKTGCDIALNWISRGAISSQWICSTDADAIVPQDYFRRLDSTAAESVAAVYPFRHAPGPDPDCNLATALYELRLHYYVLGLAYAGSPYARQTLGSALAVKAAPYTQVRGFPRRSGGEDFYLLNKLAKLGPIESLEGDCIVLHSRQSRRVPFGTGPAVARIAAAEEPVKQALFYHPQSFLALRCLLNSIPGLRQDPAAKLLCLLEHKGLERQLAQTCQLILERMKFASALAHCHRQSNSEQQFLRQFHQWFDAFRTLKFIHGIRDAGWARQSLPGLDPLQPRLWPAGSSSADGVDNLRRAIIREWGWF